MKPNEEKSHLLRLPIVIVAIGWIAFVACAFSDAGSGYGLSFSIFCFVGLVWGLVWLCRLIVSGASGAQPLRRAPFYWSFEPLFFLFSAVMLWGGVFYSIRFRLCRTSFESYVTDVIAGRVQPQGFDDSERRVGLFRIYETEFLSENVVRMRTQTVFTDDFGFIYSPNSAPPRGGGDCYNHVTGPWWHWRGDY